jgi:hypothetical protein
LGERFNRTEEAVGSNPIGSTSSNFRLNYCKSALCPVLRGLLENLRSEVIFGAVAQLGERFNGIEEVVGSNPICSTLTIGDCELRISNKALPSSISNHKSKIQNHKWH